MLKGSKSFLSFLLALTLVFTTFGSDFATASVYATSEEQGIEEGASLFEAIPEGEEIDKLLGNQSQNEGQNGEDTLNGEGSDDEEDLTNPDQRNGVQGADGNGENPTEEGVLPDADGAGDDLTDGTGEDLTPAAGDETVPVAADGEIPVIVTEPIPGTGTAAEENKGVNVTYKAVLISDMGGDPVVKDAPLYVGTSSSGSSYTVLSASSDNIPPYLWEEGYYYEKQGYYADEACTEALEAAETYDVTEAEVTVYVKYQQNINIPDSVYVIEYYKDGEVESVSYDGYSYNNVGRPDANRYEGYELVNVEYYRDNELLEVAENETPLIGEGGSLLVKAYYELIAAETQTASYTVEYYLDGVIDDALTDRSGSGEVGTKADFTANESIYVGDDNVKYDHVATEYFSRDDGIYVKLDGEDQDLIREDGNLVIRAYYAKEESKTAKYTVEYYKDGKLAEKDDTQSGEVGTKADFEADQQKYASEERAYAYDETLFFARTDAGDTALGEGEDKILENDQLVIKVYYKSTKAKYTIEFYKNDVLAERYTETSYGTIGEKAAYDIQWTKFSKLSYAYITTKYYSREGGIDTVLSGNGKNLVLDNDRLVIKAYYKQRFSRQPVYFFLESELDYFADGWAHKSLFYIPEGGNDTGLIWKGTATDINELYEKKDELTASGDCSYYEEPEDQGIYFSFYDQTKGIRELSGFAFNDGVQDLVTAKVKEFCRSEDFSESDVLWYVYKRQNAGPLHIDGFITTYITYHPYNNNDMFETDQTQVEGAALKFGSDFNVLKNMFTRDGYTFKGWGDENGNKLYDGITGQEKVTMLTEKLHLYAIWEKDPVYEAQYSVEYYYQDEEGNFVRDDAETVGPKPVTLASKDATEYVAAEYEKDPFVKKTDGVTYLFDEDNNDNYLSETLHEGSDVTLKVYYKRYSGQYSVEYYYEDADLDNVFAKDDYETVGPVKLYFANATEEKPIKADYVENVTKEIDKDGKKVTINYTFDAANTDNYLSDTLIAGGNKTLRVYYVRDKFVGDYKVEYYYQRADGTFPEKPDETDGPHEEVFNTKTEVHKVSVTPDEKKVRDDVETKTNVNYTLADDGRNRLSADLKAEGHETLLVYYFRDKITASYEVQYYFENTKNEFVQDTHYGFDYKEVTFKYPYVGKPETVKEDPEDQITRLIDESGIFVKYFMLEDSTMNILEKDVYPGEHAVLKVYYIRVNRGKGLVIRAKDKSKVYDGTALVQPEYEVFECDVKTKEETAVDFVTATTKGSIINVGTEPNVVDTVSFGGHTYEVIEDEDGKPTIEQEDYDWVKIFDGTLEITPIVLDVYANNDSKMYGFEDPKEFTAYAKKEVKGEDGSITYEDFDMAELAKIATYEIHREAGENVKENDEKDADPKKYPIDFKNCTRLNDNYTVNYHPGEFVINPRPVKLLSGTKLDEPFTGKPISCEEVKVVLEPDKFYPFVGDENVYVKMDPESYVIYPGEGQTEGKENKFEVTGPAEGTRLSNYVITTEFGRLSVLHIGGDKKIKIYISAGVDGENKKVKVYNGEKQTLPVNIKFEGDVEEEEEGSSTVIENFKELIEKFKQSLKNFLVLKASASEGKEYKKTFKMNGVTYTLDGIYVTGGEGLDVNYSGEGDDKQIAPYPLYLDTRNMKITVNEMPVSDEFDVELVSAKTTTTEGVSEIGELWILPRPVLLTSESYTRYFDGTPLTRPNVTEVYKGVEDKNFVDGEVTDLRATGTITMPGSVPNPITFTPVGNFKLGNYDIEKQEGTLRILQVDDDIIPPPDVPTDPPTDPPTNPPAVLGAVRGEVLGASRDPAVLGARRGRTSDDTNLLGRIITILAAAGIGFTMIFIKRKKEEDQ